jgi:hypothetical protein
MAVVPPIMICAVFIFMIRQTGIMPPAIGSLQSHVHSVLSAHDL